MDRLLELKNALLAESRLAIAYYRDLPGRTDLVDDVRALTPLAVPVLETADADHALAHPDSLAILVPADESAALDTLEGRRRALEPRSQPVVVLLIAGGTGEERLRHLPGIASFAHGSVFVDREEVADGSLTREGFLERTGVPPAAWLAAWRAGDIEDTDANARLLVEALALEPG